MITLFQNSNKQSKHLTRFVTSPAWFAVGLGILARELVHILTDSHLAGGAVFLVVGYAVWKAVESKTKSIAEYETEKKEHKAHIKLLEEKLSECEDIRKIDNSKKHNLSTYTKGTSKADIEFFKSLLRWGGLPDTWEEDVKERIAANTELCEYIDNTIPSDKVINRLFGVNETKKRH